MTDKRPIREYSNEQLQAYLAGAADAELGALIESQLAYDEMLQSRLAQMDSLTATVRAPFDSLLAMAPTERMTDRLNTAIENIDDGAGKAGSRTGRWVNRLRSIDFTRAPALGAAAVSLIAAFALGIVSSRIFPPAPGGGDAPAWIAAAADYQNLHMVETLTSAPRSDAEKSALVEKASEHLALNLSPAVVDLPRLFFQKSEVLQFEGRPLVQMAYLHDSGKPFALYVLSGGDEPANAPPDTDFIKGEIEGLKVTYWAWSGFEFLTLGDLTSEQMDEIAETLAWRIGP